MVVVMDGDGGDGAGAGVDGWGRLDITHLLLKGEKLKDLLGGVLHIG